MSSGQAAQARVLVLAPAGRDARLAAEALAAGGIATSICPSVEAFCCELERGAGAGLLTEEALAPITRAPLVTALRAQPVWADLPLVVFASRPSSRDGVRRLAAAIEELGNVTLLDRPLHPDTMVSALRAALRARARQYQARELLSRLEEAVRERDKFLATLSHELRNPLGAIRNAMRLVERRQPGTNLDRPIAIVDRQVTHLARLIDDLLDVSRVTTGKVVLRRQITDVREIARQAVQQLEPACLQSRLGLRAELGESPLLVDGDPVRIDQILSNLLTNAIKYTPAGGMVELTAGIDSGDVWLQVADTGVGLESDMLTGIFDMFAQVDRSLDRAQGGMGIGLTLVRSLVQLHGGTVTASSAGLGQGSVFLVRLPIADGPSQRDTPPTGHLITASNGHDARNGRHHPPRHVLLVEDSEDNREMLRALLELDGFRVDVAVDGLEGVGRALALHPQVAIVDIGLPEIDGYEVARRVRAALGTSIRLVALTGYGQPEDHHRTSAAGFDAHLTKPVDPELLASVLTAS